MIRQLRQQLDIQEKETNLSREKLELMNEKSSILKLTETRYNELRKDYEKAKADLDQKQRESELAK